MITRFHIQNYKCLRDVAVDLAPLTVLIGPNNSGKTSLLEAIRMLGQSTREGLARPMDPSLFWRRNTNVPICWDVKGLWNWETGQAFEYELEIPSGHKDIVEKLSSKGNPESISIKGNPESISIKGRRMALALDGSPTELWRLSKNSHELNVSISKSLQTSHIYKFDPSKARNPCAPIGGELSARGDNLVAVLDALVTGPDRASFDELETTLRKTFSDIAGIALPSEYTSEKMLVKRIEFVLKGNERPKVRIPASYISDGVMLLTSYLALAYSDTPEIILLEEPENGLHPSRLKMVIDILRQMSQGEIGNKKRQILLTTHSPLLLNYCQKDEVRILRRRDEDGGSEVTPLSQVPDIDKLLGQFAIGELWNLLGEEGLLKGEPAGGGA